jgi:hypothetical protein
VPNFPISAFFLSIFIKHLKSLKLSLTLTETGKNDMGNKNHTFLTQRQKHRQSCRLVDSLKSSLQCFGLSYGLGYRLCFGLCFGMSLWTTGCSTVGVLVGDKAPVSQKSDHYHFLDLSTEPKSQWKKVSPENVANDRDQNEDIPENEISDIVFQSAQTASIISLNSSCRDNSGYRQKTLTDLTELLLLGVEAIQIEDQEPIEVAGQTALQTTATGSVDQLPRKLRIVVLKSKGCVYDLMFFSSPDYFEVEKGDFARFVASLIIRD